MQTSKFSGCSFAGVPTIKPDQGVPKAPARPWVNQRRIPVVRITSSGERRKRVIVAMAITDEQRLEFRMRRKPKSSFLEIKKILSLLKDGYTRSAYVQYMHLRRAKRKVITRPQYIYLATIFGRLHGLHIARIIFDDMHRRHKPCTHAYNSLMRVYAEMGHPQKCRELFDEISGKFLAPDLTSYNVLMEAWIRKDETIEALNVYDQMRESGFTPNSKSIDLLMEGAQRDGNYSQVLETDRIRVEFNDVRRTTDTYAMLIRANAELGQYESVHAAYQAMLDDFREYSAWQIAKEQEQANRAEGREAQIGSEDADLSVHSQSSLICSEEDVEVLDDNQISKMNKMKADEQRFTERGKNSSVEELAAGDGGPSYAATFSDTDEEDLEVSFEQLRRLDSAWEEQESSSIKMTGGESWGDAEGGDVSLRDLANDEWDEDSTFENEGRMSQTIAWPETVRTVDSGFTAMVQVCAHAQPEALREVLEEAERSPAELSIEFFAACASSFIITGDLEGVRLMIDQLDTHSSGFSLEAQSAKLRGYTALKDKDGVDKIRGLFTSGELKPDKYSLNMLIDAYRQLGHTSEAESSFEELRAIGVKGNLGTYNILLQMYADLGQTENAFEIIHRMYKRKLRPNTRSFNLLLQSCMQSNNMETVVPTFRRIRTIGIQDSWNTQSIEMLLEAAARSKSTKMMDEVMHELDACGVNWDESIFTKVASIYSDSERGYSLDGIADLEHRLLLIDAPPMSYIAPVVEALTSSGNEVRAEVLLDSLSEKHRSDQPYLEKLRKAFGVQLEYS